MRGRGRMLRAQLVALKSGAHGLCFRFIFILPCDVSVLCQLYPDYDYE